MSVGDPEAAFERNRVRVGFRGKVEFLFEFNRGSWVKKSLQDGKLRRDPEPLLLSDVIADPSIDDYGRQRALEIDAEGASRLSSDALAARG
jgi:hypothetical protein